MCRCLLQRAIHDRDTAIIESQFGVATESGSDHLSDANGSENSAGEVCISLTYITPCIRVMRPLHKIYFLYAQTISPVVSKESLETAGEMVWAYKK